MKLYYNEEPITQKALIEKIGKDEAKHTITCIRYYYRNTRQRKAMVDERILKNGDILKAVFEDNEGKRHTRLFNY